MVARHKQDKHKSYTKSQGKKNPGSAASGPRTRVDAAKGGRKTAFFAAALTILIVVWAIVNLTVEGAGFAMSIPDKLWAGEEAASALTRLFAALVLGLFLSEDSGRRMRWVAGGLAVLGLGHLAFGYLEPLLQGDPVELNESLYEVLVTQIFAGALFAVGLFPARLPRPLAQAAIAIPVALVAGYILVFEFMEGEHWMPLLARIDSAEIAVGFGSPFSWLTPWHWTLSTLPLGLAIVAVAGAFRQSWRGRLRGWLLFAMVLLAGSLLHEYFWPSAYGSGVLTTADVMRLAFAAVVAIGGVSELRRVAAERSSLLATERERARRLSELAALKADFNVMVAHELDGPIAAIRRLTEMLSAEGSDAGVRQYATTTIESEIDALNALVRDVREAAAIERADFKVRPRALRLDALLTEAESYASTLPGGHPVKSTFNGDLEAHEQVRADPERIGQVLRNLLSNAAKYSPASAPIELRAARRGARIRLEVADRGQGIHPDDLGRIFEKFGRGRDRRGRKVAGVGLGLYLSQRIVQSHGSKLTVETEPGKGSVFGFDLEVMR